MSEELEPKKNAHYGAENIQVLEGLEAVRKRPAMQSYSCTDTVVSALAAAACH
jgi:DNA gyrase/topoisomerase IV subunit B